MAGKGRERVGGNGGDICEFISVQQCVRAMREKTSPSLTTSTHQVWW